LYCISRLKKDKKGDRMSFLGFGKKPTTKEIVRDQKRGLTRQGHDLDRELAALDREEKKLQVEIKRLAAAGQTTSAKTLAVQIVRIRKQREQIYGMKGKLSSVSTHATGVVANEAMANSMASATKVSATMNRAMPAQRMQAMTQQFSKEQAQMEMKEEMIDDMFADESLDDEADEQVAAVLDSIGLEAAARMPSASKHHVPAAEADQDVDALIARLAAVKSP